jgi:2-methylisocitrate lyase-like PEP mutase family enzyme
MTTPDADPAARFLALHRPGQPLLLPNPWDLGSADLGVARISVGGAFAFAALSALVEAARELRTAGTYDFLRGARIGRQVSGAAFPT